jgi:predicted permease
MPENEFRPDLVKPPVMRDLKLAFRTLFRTPFVTVVAILSLALGIGANAAIFSLFNQMILKSLPVQAPEELVNLAAPGPKPGSQSCGQAGGCDVVFSFPMFRDLEREQTVFTGIAAHRQFGANLAYGGDVASGEGLLVSGSYFQVLGSTPALGRLISRADERAIDESPVVVLSHAYWTTRFDANPAILNETMSVNGRPMTIIGVAPEGFHGTTLGSRPQVYAPMTMRGFMEPGSRSSLENRRSYWVYLFARLNPGVAMEQAAAGLNAYYRSVITEVEAPLQTGMSEATLQRFREKEVVLTEGLRGQSDVNEEAAAPLTILMIVTGCVLLIACANVANLLLARSAARSGEMAVRLSIGASRGRLVRQLLTEAALLAMLGGFAGLAVARLTLNLLASLLPGEVSQTIPFVIDGPVLAFAGVLSVATGLLFGLFPALHSSRPDLLSILKSQSGQPSGAKAAKWFRWSLATGQVLLAMWLLGAAGLFVKSLANVSRVDLGLANADDVITFRLSPELNGYTVDRIKTFYAELEELLSSQPGVTSVSSSLVPLLSGSSWGNSVSVQGYPTGPDVDNNSRYNWIGAGYLRTLGMPLMSGREFTAADTAGAPKVAVVNEAFADKFGLGREAVGRLMSNSIGDAVQLDIEIVGIVQNAKYSDVKQEVPPIFMLPWRQQERAGSLSFYVQTAVDPELFMASIRPLVARLDPNLPVDNLRTMEQQVLQNVGGDRVISIMATSFAGLATILAAIGLYGVLAYTVSQRMREFGLRMALGAAPGRVRGLVLKQVGMMTLVGGLFGLAAAAATGVLGQSLLFEIEGYDPGALGASAAILVGVALLAGFIPAYRASRVDPMTALRYE